MPTIRRRDLFKVSLAVGGAGAAVAATPVAAAAVPLTTLPEAVTGKHVHATCSCGAWGVGTCPATAPVGTPLLSATFAPAGTPEKIFA